SDDRARCRERRAAPRSPPPSRAPAVPTSSPRTGRIAVSAIASSVGFQHMSVLYFLLLVGVLVVIHELGHFAAAKLLDVKVLRFSLGYGRPLVRVKLRETEYQLAVFPLGGYVRILGIEASDS